MKFAIIGLSVMLLAMTDASMLSGVQSFILFVGFAMVSIGAAWGE